MFEIVFYGIGANKMNEQLYAFEHGEERAYDVSLYEVISFIDESFPIYIINDMTLEGRTQTPETDSASSPPKVLWHEQLEIIYVIEGKITCISNFKKHTCQAGDIAIINPCESHGIEYAGEKGVYHCLMIDLKLCGGLGDMLVHRYIDPIISHKVRFTTVIEQNGAAENIINELIDAYNKKEEGFELTVKGNLLRFLGYLYKSSESGTRKKDAHDAILPALRYISEHYVEAIALSDLAASCCMNRSYFCRLFHGITGRTAITYLNEFRMTKARMLLATTSSSISEIAVSVGFPDSGYFTRRFKQLYGISPGAFRKQL